MFNIITQFCVWRISVYPQKLWKFKGMHLIKRWTKDESYLPIEYHYLDETNVNIMTVIVLNTDLENVRVFLKKRRLLFYPTRTASSVSKQNSGVVT